MAKEEKSEVRISKKREKTFYNRPSENRFFQSSGLLVETRRFLSRFGKSLNSSGLCFWKFLGVAEAIKSSRLCTGIVPALHCKGNGFTPESHWLSIVKPTAFGCYGNKTWPKTHRRCCQEAAQSRFSALDAPVPKRWIPAIIFYIPTALQWPVLCRPSPRMVRNPYGLQPMWTHW